MPKLLMFAPCETVLIGQDGNASLIVLLQQFMFQDRPDPIPPNTITQMKWHIFSEWEASPDEVGVSFEQKIELLNAAQEVQGHFQLMATFIPEAGKPLHRMIANLTFLPVISEGQYRLYLSIRRVGEENWVVVADYPLRISYAKPVAPVTAVAQ
jgi:hypothetical protein